MRDIEDRLREPLPADYSVEQVNAERREAADEIMRLRQGYWSISRSLIETRSPRAG